MSVTAPRCHLCHKLKTATAGGLLICRHCDFEYTASKPCHDCKSGAKSGGRGPST